MPLNVIGCNYASLQRTPERHLFLARCVPPTPCCSYGKLSANTELRSSGILLGVNATCCPHLALLRLLAANPESVQQLRLLSAAIGSLQQIPSPCCKSGKRAATPKFLLQLVCSKSVRQLRLLAANPECVANPESLLQLVCSKFLQQIQLLAANPESLLQLVCSKS